LLDYVGKIGGDGWTLNDTGISGGVYPPERPVAEFISENPQDSKINDAIFTGLRSSNVKILSGICVRKTEGL
jgi:hypothetical protein